MESVSGAHPEDTEEALEYLEVLCFQEYEDSLRTR